MDDAAPLDVVVRQLIAEQMGCEPGELTRGTRFVEDLNADSLELVELLMAFKDEFERLIPDRDAERLKTVGDVIDYLSGPGGRKRRGPNQAAA